LLRLWDNPLPEARNPAWLRLNYAFHINGQSDSSLKRIIPERSGNEIEKIHSIAYSFVIVIINQSQNIFLELRADPQKYVATATKLFGG
jgi:hypothetical protein